MEYLRIAGICSALIAYFPGGVALSAEASGEAERVNFVIILVDDLGWMDLACQGSRYYDTPNIDHLAAEGMRFRDAYAACAVCSPTRAALLTGRYPARLGVPDWIRARFQGGQIPADSRNPQGFQKHPKRVLMTPENALWMELDEVTLAEALATAGYARGFIGKWHLGADAWYPDKQGFDVNVGGCDYGQPPTYFFPFQNKRQPAMPGLESGEVGEYLTDREAAEAVQFIQQHQDRPFLLYLAHYAVHTPIQAKADLQERYAAKPRQGQKNAAYAAMIHSVDQAVGQVLDALDRLKLAGNTVVIFTSDNGGLAGVTDNSPLRAGKGTPFDGGIRVPMIVRWPEVVPPGSTCNVPVSSVDLFPTVLEIADVPLPEGRPIDGESLVGLLGKEPALEREAIYWHFPHYRQPEVTPYGIVRAGDFKLIRYYEDNRVELYNLAEDLGEQTDLAAQQPDKSRQLDTMLSKWLIGVGAKMPVPNPEHQPPPPPDAQ